MPKAGVPTNSKDASSSPQGCEPQAELGWLVPKIRLCPRSLCRTTLKITNKCPCCGHCCCVLMLQLHARHHQQHLNDPLQLAFSPLLPPGTFIRETSSFIQPPLQPPPPTTQTATATATTENSTPDTAQPAGATGNGRSHHPSSSSSNGGSSGGGWPSLPPNVHVLSMQWRSCSSLLVRLVNIFQAGEEDPQRSVSPAAAAAGGAANAAAAAAVSSSREPLADTSQAGERRQRPLSDTATVESLWKLFSWGSSQDNEAAGSWYPGLSVVDVREVTLFGQRQLTESDLQPALKGWPLVDSITQWEPTLWPPAGSDTSSSSSSSLRTSASVTAADRAPGAAAKAGRYSFLSNRVVGPMDAAKPITLAPMQVWLAVLFLYAYCWFRTK
jgi:hypothetical protein